MSRSIFIRSLSGFLLLVFAFSITPKLFLHTLFAGHVDNVVVKNSKAPYQITHSGFNCDKDGVVATSPFVAEDAVINFPFPIFFSAYISGETSFNSAEKLFYRLRGPPAENIYLSTAVFRLMQLYSQFYN